MTILNTTRTERAIHAIGEGNTRINTRSTADSIEAPVFISSTRATQSTSIVEARQARFTDLTQTFALVMAHNYRMRDQNEGKAVNEENVQRQVQSVLRVLQNTFGNTAINTGSLDFRAILLHSYPQDQVLRELLQGTLPAHQSFQLYLDRSSHLDLNIRDYNQAQLDLARSFAHQSGSVVSEFLSALNHTAITLAGGLSQNETAYSFIESRFNQWAQGIGELLEGNVQHWRRSGNESALNESYLALANQMAQSLSVSVEHSNITDPVFRQELRYFLNEDLGWQAGAHELSHILRTHSLIFSRTPWDLLTPAIGAFSVLGGARLGALRSNPFLSSIIGAAAGGAIQTLLQSMRVRLETGEFRGPPLGMQTLQAAAMGAVGGLVGHTLGVFFNIARNSPVLGQLSVKGAREFRWASANLSERTFRFMAAQWTALKCDDLLGTRNIQNLLGLRSAADQGGQGIVVNRYFRFVNNAAASQLTGFYGARAQQGLRNANQYYETFLLRSAPLLASFRAQLFSFGFMEPHLQSFYQNLLSSSQFTQAGINSHSGVLGILASFGLLGMSLIKPGTDSWAQLGDTTPKAAEVPPSVPNNIQAPVTPTPLPPVPVVPRTFDLRPPAPSAMPRLGTSLEPSFPSEVPSARPRVVTHRMGVATSAIPDSVSIPPPRGRRATEHIPGVQLPTPRRTDK